jgi:hypothetical protein
MAEDFAKSIEDGGRIPEEIPGMAERLIGDRHEAALKKQNEILNDFKPDFEKALEGYLSAISGQVTRLTQVRDREGAGYLKRESEATSGDKERFRAILNGEFPPVPEGRNDE